MLLQKVLLISNVHKPVIFLVVKLLARLLLCYLLLVMVFKRVELMLRDMQGAFSLYLPTLSDLAQIPRPDYLLLLAARVGIYAVAVNLIDLVFEVDAGGGVAAVVFFDFFFILILLVMVLLLFLI